MHMLHDALRYLCYISLCHLHCMLLFGNGCGYSSLSVLGRGNGFGRHWRSLQRGTTLRDGWPGIDLVLRRPVQGLLGTCQDSRLLGTVLDSGVLVGVHCPFSIRSRHGTGWLWVGGIWCLEGVDSQKWTLVSSFVSWGQTNNVLFLAECLIKFQQLVKRKYNMFVSLVMFIYCQGKRKKNVCCRKTHNTREENGK